MRKFTKKIKLFSLLVLSYLIVNFLNKTVFLANSPKINPFFVQKMLAFLKQPTRFLAKKNEIKISEIRVNPIAITPVQQNKVSPPSPPSSPKDEDKTIALKDDAEILLQTAKFKTLGRGVYAAEGTDNYKIYKYVIDEIEWKEYVFTLKDGRIVKIKLPVGVSPPPQESVELLFRE